MSTYLRRLLSRTAEGHKKQKGQALVMVALALSVLLGFAGLALDTGLVLTTRGEIQHGADAMALAGAGDLPNTVTADESAREWGAKNEIASDEVVNVTFGSTCSGQMQVNTITVRVERDQPAIFLGVLGVTDSTVPACATAQIGSPAQLDRLVPLSVLEESINYDGTPTVLKFDAGNISNGNTMSLKLDGPGADQFEENLKFGSEQDLCARETDPDNQICTASSEVDTEPGVKIGATRDGINYRLDNTSFNCDAFEEVFQERDDGSYSIRAGCNPFNGDAGSKRILLIPVIEELCNGRCTVTVKRFAIFWLEELGPCMGNTCEVRGTFVNVRSDIGGKLGGLNSDGAIVFVRLVN